MPSERNLLDMEELASSLSTLGILVNSSSSSNLSLRVTHLNSSYSLKLQDILYNSFNTNLPAFKHNRSLCKLKQQDILASSNNNLDHNLLDIQVNLEGCNNSQYNNNLSNKSSRQGFLHRRH